MNYGIDYWSLMPGTVHMHCSTDEKSLKCLFLLIDPSTCKYVKFMYSEKAIKFCDIFTFLLSYVVPVKNKVEISQNFVAFSKYMNFTKKFFWVLVVENLVKVRH